MLTPQCAFSAQGTTLTPLHGAWHRYEAYSGVWNNDTGMATNFSTNGMSFVLRTKSYLLAVTPENGGATQVENGAT